MSDTDEFSKFFGKSELQSPSSLDAVQEIVRAAHWHGTPIYPIGGQTALGYGLPPKPVGIGLSLKGLDKVIDYPARDMTITLEAGVTMANLARQLASERQRLPIDVPQAEQATIGGVVATNWNGPHRFGLGTMRDYVIGVSAIDGRGMLFKGGGRVVKNVAGYDMCKLLTGSCGTLGVITQVTLKVKPIPEELAWVVSPVADHVQAERLLSALNTSQIAPAAVEWLSGPAWHADPLSGNFTRNGAGCLAVALEGTKTEVDWMLNHWSAELESLGVAKSERVASPAAVELFDRLTAFPADKSPPLSLRFAILPSKMFSAIELAREVDPVCSVQAHAGNGIVNVRFANFSANDVGGNLVGRLQPIATRAGGKVTALTWNGGGELTRQAVFGSTDLAGTWMQKVKREFDPKGVLNPGRFIV